MVRRLLYVTHLGLVYALCLFLCIHAENIALNKLATQIGTFGAQGPQFANDGNLSRSLWTEVCSLPHSDGDDVSPAEKGADYSWWTVDLASSQDPSQRFGIKSVTVYTCLCQGRNRTIVIYVGQQSRWQNQAECGRGYLAGLAGSETVVNITCRPAAPVRYLTVREIRGSGFPLCEVNVNGYLYQGPPVITEVTPTVGPQSGGTEVTLLGYNLYRDNETVQVLIDKLECSVHLRNDSLIVCKTPRVDQSIIDLPRNLTVEFDETGIIIDVKEDFTYKEDPTITKVEPTETIISGGVLLTVSGTGLDIVGKPVLEVTVLNRGSLVYTSQSVCRSMNATQMHCSTPPLEILNEDGSLSSNPMRGRRKRRMSHEYDNHLKKSVLSNLHFSLERSRRQATNNKAVGFRINNATIEIQIGFILDGVQEFRNLTETLPQYSRLNVYTNPKFMTWKGMKVVTFGMKMLEVEGDRLITGIQASDYKMLIGDSSCVTLTVYSNRIICTAPDSTPNPHLDDSSLSPLGVRIHIGVYLKPFFIGQVTYKTSFFDNPIAKWGIIGGCVVVVLVVVSLIAVKIKKSGK